MLSGIVSAAFDVAARYAATPPFPHPQCGGAEKET